jgi:hypothetical protein
MMGRGICVEKKITCRTSRMDFFVGSSFSLVPLLLVLLFHVLCPVQYEALHHLRDLRERWGEGLAFGRRGGAEDPRAQVAHALGADADAQAIIKLIEKQNIDNKDELSTKATNDLLDKLKFDLMPTKFTFPEKTSPKVIETEITWTKSRGIIGDPFVVRFPIFLCHMS